MSYHLKYSYLMGVSGFPLWLDTIEDSFGSFLKTFRHQKTAYLSQFWVRMGAVSGNYGGTFRSYCGTFRKIKVALLGKLDSAVRMVTVLGEENG